MELGAFAMESVANAVAVSVPFVEASRLVFRGLVEQLEALEKRAESGGLEKQTTQTSTPPVFEPTTEGLVSRAVEDWINLDRRLASRLVGNAVATRASAATGTALLRAALAAFGENDDDEQGAEERTETHEKEEQRRSGFGSKQVTSAFLRVSASPNSKFPFPVCAYSYQKGLLPLTVCPYIAIYKTDPFFLSTVEKGVARRNCAKLKATRGAFTHGVRRRVRCLGIFWHAFS